jgi:RNA polymerase sigma-70 factor (ECF subfamily)
MDGRTLVQAALDDREQFAAIVERHKGMVFSVGYHFFGDRALAEDLAQEVFLGLFRSLDRIQSDAHLAHWLRQAVTRKCIDQARWGRNHGTQSLDRIPEPSASAEAPDPFLSQAVRNRVLALPEKMRLMIILRFQEEMELSEIGETLSVPVNTVKSTLHRALGLLRDKLSAFTEVKRYGTTRA